MFVVSLKRKPAYLFIYRQITPFHNPRPWHDAQAIAHARVITCANQEKVGGGGACAGDQKPALI